MDSESLLKSWIMFQKLQRARWVDLNLSLSSYGWDGTYKTHPRDPGSSKIEVVGAMEVNGSPSESDIKEINIAT